MYITKSLTKTGIILFFIYYLFAGNICAQRSAYSSSWRYTTDSLIQQLKISKSDTSRILLLHKIGDLYKRTIPDSAFHYYNIALTISVNIKNEKFTALSLCDIGLFYVDKGDYNKALKYFFNSLKINEEISDKKGLAQSLTYIGIVNLEQGLYDKALEYFTKSLKIFKEIDFKKGIIMCNTNIGNIYLYQGSYDKAIEFYTKSLKMYEETGDKYGMSVCYNNLGSTYYNKKIYKNAITNFTNSLKIKQELGDKHGISGVLSSLAALNIKLKNYNKAVEYALEGLKFAKETKSLPQEKLAYECLSVANDSLHNYQKAFEYHKLFKEINDSIFNEERSKQITEMHTKYDTEKKEKELLVKGKELQIQDLKISRMNLYLFILAIIIILILTIAFFIIRKNKYQSLLKNIQLEQILLQSQMNPHFIFNSLSVIQSIIYQNKTEFAVKYLSRFAKLTRIILENSRAEYVTLDKEITMIELYLDLQSIRFENKFNYVIEVDPELSPEMIAIPPMLAQPFIENSIEHGIMHKEKSGNIKISFKTGKDMLLFEVTDDGVGREKSKEIKEQSNDENKHVSLATTITQERIENINKSLKKKIKLDITDLKDESGYAMGTKVAFFIPFKAA
ncbi:MAG: tetratricopeptide repeat protein [Bacteroidetes bacterium]|nr:tetratricopeptide repeat protein [Bacteroidota bacterium]